MATKDKNIQRQSAFSINRRHPPVGFVRGNGSLVSVAGAGIYKCYANDEIVTTSGSQAFRCPELAGFGDDYFNGWTLMFQGNCANTSNLGKGEQNFVTDYHDDGTFDTDVDWSGNVQQGDEFLLSFPQALGGRILVPAKHHASPLASTDLWSISGPIIVYDIFGIVTTTAIQAQATTVQLKFDPDDGGSDVALDAGSYDATGAAIGTIIRWTGDLSDALAASLDVAEAPSYDSPAYGVVIGQAGDIKVVYGAASTGQINWFIRYESIIGAVTQS